MGLQEMLEKDLPIFFNTDDFGTLHRVEGAEICIVVDDDGLNEHNAKMGIAEASLLFYAKEEDLPKRRATGNTLNFDGREKIIVNWGINNGVATILLADNLVV